MDSLGNISRRVDTDRIRGHILALQGVRHPLAAPEALERAADYVATGLTDLGYEMAEHPVAAEGRVFRNIIATRPGSDPQRKRVLVLAHYDTVAGSPGADDNASGVAVLLEIATVLAPLRFERTLHLVGLTLEENTGADQPGTGTRGSLALVAHARENDWSIAGAVVLESVGYAGDEVVQTAPDRIPVAVPAIGNFIAAVGNEQSKDLVETFSRAIERLGKELPLVPLVVPGNGELLPDSRRSDHAPFWDAGYRAIMLTDTTNFRSPHYHQPTDTLETLNLEFATRVCQATTEMVLALARVLPEKDA